LRLLQQVEILKALILGEEERGQSQYQVMCFVSHFDKADGFIAPDAMAKLRQKNPGTVRTPEEDRGRQNTSMDGLVEPFSAKLVSPLLPGVCAEAKDATYAPLADLRIWSELAGRPLLQNSMKYLLAGIFLKHFSAYFSFENPW